jgi:hypothetical protein
MYVKCPGGCGRMVDYDTAPSYSEKKQRAGKFCDCGFPLDEDTAKKDVLEYGPDSAKVMESRAASAKAFHEASHDKSLDPKPEPATPTP